MLFVAFIAKNLFRRPTRTALTVLGLAVAVGSMIALLGVSDNVTRSVSESFDKRGIDLVVLQGGKPDQLNSDFGETFVEQAKAIPGVEDLSATTVEYLNLTRPSGSEIGVMVQGWPADDIAYRDLSFVEGRRLLPDDYRKVIVGATRAESLGTKVGDTLTILDQPFEVVGIFKSFVVFENGGVIMPLKEAQKLTGKRITGFSLRVARLGGDEDAEIEAVRQKLAALRDPADQTVRLDAQTTKSYVNTVSHLRITRAMAWMVSAIAVLIGVISMLNTMVMSVLERTQEIGILRAVGWPRGRVVRMVLGEAVLLGTAAAAVGTVGAFGLTHLLTLSPKVNGFITGGISPGVAGQGLLVTVLIGLVGGAYPAFRAARLLPTEAIRHD